MLDRLLDLNHPFFIPLWRRVLIVAVCLIWTLVEAATQNIMWAAIFGCIGLYAGWHFFFNFNPRSPDDPKP
jgi:hypothetical protein